MPVRDGRADAKPCVHGATGRRHPPSGARLAWERVAGQAGTRLRKRATICHRAASGAHLPRAQILDAVGKLAFVAVRARARACERRA